VQLRESVERVTGCNYAGSAGLYHDTLFNSTTLGLQAHGDSIYIPPLGCFVRDRAGAREGVDGPAKRPESGNG